MRSAHEAEAAVVGGVLLDPDAYPRCEGLRPEDFERDDCRRVWAHVCEEVRSGRKVVARTLMDSRPDLAADACQIAAAAVSSRHIEQHAQRVREAAGSRRMVEAGKQIMVLGDKITYGEAQRILVEAAPKSASELRNAEQIVLSTFEEMYARLDRGDALKGLSTGLPSLDSLTNGLQGGNLYVLAGRPSMGKSLIAMQIAAHIACQKKRVLVFSLEMTAEQIVQRMVSALSGVPHDCLEKPGLLKDAHWPPLHIAAAKVKESGLIIDPEMSRDMAAIAAQSHMAHMQSPLSLIVIDHLGLIERPGKRSDQAEIGDDTRWCKRLAKELGIPVMLLCQLNRALETRANKEPMLSDLRDSGRIEEDADTVAMIHRPNYFEHGDDEERTEEEIDRNPERAVLFIRKSRSGRRGDVHLYTDLPRMRMRPAPKPTDLEKALSNQRNRAFQMVPA